MNDFYPKSGIRILDMATHKPKISMAKTFDGRRYYKCTDGGATQYGWTPLEAFNALASIR